MIELRDVSKYYYRKGMITSGISKVDLEFDIGEFVVITGESGSGKSTLLNVISGVDTYEEGEMYIEGKETSHYSEEEFEDYRRHYIANVFQDFNLVKSYTAKQNVELILQVNGYDKKEVSGRSEKILERVGLSEYMDTKVSKLSGGQQQRVAIARALAKETSIITADEPTGNLDSGAAEEIAGLLGEAAKDRLVIVVTHNYEQFAGYATRLIKMSDGRVAEDRVIKKPDIRDEIKDASRGRMRPGTKLRIGVRNTFNIAPKFLLLLAVFLFAAVSTASVYVGLKNNSEERETAGYNQFFSNYQDTRIVIRHQDRSIMKDADHELISSMKNVDSIEKNDVILDQYLTSDDGDAGIQGYPRSLSEFNEKIDEGAMPKSSDQAVLVCAKNSLSTAPEAIIGRTYAFFPDADGDSTVRMKVKISGICYLDDEDDQEDFTIYMSEKKLSGLRDAAYMESSTVTTSAGGQQFVYTSEEGTYMLHASDRIRRGRAAVPAEFNAAYGSGSAAGKNIKITVKNMYFKKEKSLKVSYVYDRKNYRKATGLENFDESMNMIFLNRSDYEKLFPSGNYQYSVFADEPYNTDKLVKEFDRNGYRALALKNALQNDGLGGIVDIVQVPLAVILLAAMFFISYFVIKLVLRSRSSYFGILRMLGLPKRDCRRLLETELLTAAGIAYCIFLLMMVLFGSGIAGTSYIEGLASKLILRDYIVLFVLLLVTALLTAVRFTGSLFGKSAMRSYREGV